jgi:tetratricopeptide (TPR) repeat protein
LLNRGIALSEWGKDKEATASFDQLLLYYPHDYLAWEGKANSLASLERYSEALNCYDRALEFNTSYYIERSKSIPKILTLGTIADSHCGVWDA